MVDCLGFVTVVMMVVLNGIKMASLMVAGLALMWVDL